MKTSFEIFKDHPEISSHPAVQELISEYDVVCDALIDLQQVSKKSKEKPLKNLVTEIQNSINVELKKDENAIRFKETERVDFKISVENLRRYINEYLQDYRIYLKNSK